jgi:adenylylsulfate kinase
VTAGRQGFTLWFTGLSGAGKSTLSQAIAGELRARGRSVERLDGDEVRLRLSRGLGFSREDRNENIRRIGFVARLLSRSGAVAIASAISPYRDVRDEIRREHDAPFVEIFVECPLDALVKRDPKGLYAKAVRGEIANFSGVSDPYEPPASPEITVRTDRESIEASRDVILRWLEARQLI